MPKGITMKILALDLATTTGWVTNIHGNRCGTTARNQYLDRKDLADFIEQNKRVIT